MSNNIQLFRASILHFPTRTFTPDTDFSCYIDGGLVIEGDKIIAVGNFIDMASDYPHATVQNHQGKWILPGFIDSHVHFPQTEMIACYGEQLLSWLDNYTFPTEKKFADHIYAEKMADVFLNQLLKNGTTTALAYASVHKNAVEALFQAATAKNMAMVTGKVCMDRHCPDDLRDTPESAQKESAQLIEQWHNKGRNFYALTPRFAPTSSHAQLTVLGELAVQYPDVFVQTHLSENLKEVEWVQSLFPERDGYLDVYDHYGLVRQRSVFGHCLHLTDKEWVRMAQAGATVAFCPTSNLFLGSGLFPMDKARQHKVSVTLATDVGAGTTFNMLNTYGEGYKVCQLQHARLSPAEGLYLMTQAPALAYGLETEIGNLNPGTIADFVIIDPYYNELNEHRLAEATHAEEMLFAMSMLGDDRCVAETWVAGQCQHNKKESIIHGGF